MRKRSQKLWLTIKPHETGRIYCLNNIAIPLGVRTVSYAAHQNTPIVLATVGVFCWAGQKIKYVRSTRFEDKKYYCFKKQNNTSYRHEVQPNSILLARLSSWENTI